MPTPTRDAIVRHRKATLALPDRSKVFWHGPRYFHALRRYIDRSLGVWKLDPKHSIRDPSWTVGCSNDSWRGICRRPIAQRPKGFRCVLMALTSALFFPENLGKNMLSDIITSLHSRLLQSSGVSILLDSEHSRLVFGNR